MGNKKIVKLFLLFAVVIASLCIVGQAVHANEISVFEKMTGDANYNVGMKVQFPQSDISKIYVSVNTSPGFRHNQFENAVKSWFDTNPRLVALKNQVHFNHYASDNPIFVDRLRGACGTDMPQVVVQLPPDQVGGFSPPLYKATGSNVPRSSDELADEIFLAMNECRPRPRPAPAPAPTPAPNVDVNVTPAYVPDVRPKDNGPDGAVVFAIVGLILVVAGVTAVIEFKKRTSDS